MRKIIVHNNTNNNINNQDSNKRNSIFRPLSNKRLNNNYNFSNKNTFLYNKTNSSSSLVHRSLLIINNSYNHKNQIKIKRKVF